MAITGRRLSPTVKRLTAWWTTSAASRTWPAGSFSCGLSVVVIELLQGEGSGRSSVNPESNEPRVGCDVIASVPRLRPPSWRATKNRATEFRPTARGARDGPWPPGDLRDGQEPTEIGAKRASHGVAADVVGHIRRLLKSRSTRAPNWVRRQDTIAGPRSSSPDKPGQVETGERV